MLLPGREPTIQPELPTTAHVRLLSASNERGFTPPSTASSARLHSASGRQYGSPPPLSPLKSAAARSSGVQRGASSATLKKWTAFLKEITGEICETGITSALGGLGGRSRRAWQSRCPAR